MRKIQLTGSIFFRFLPGSLVGVADLLPSLPSLELSSAILLLLSPLLLFEVLSRLFWGITRRAGKETKLLTNLPEIVR